jgi:hypothetical protein
MFVDRELQKNFALLLGVQCSGQLARANTFEVHMVQTKNSDSKSTWHS